VSRSASYIGTHVQPVIDPVGAIHSARSESGLVYLFVCVRFGFSAYQFSGLMVWPEACLFANIRMCLYIFIVVRVLFHLYAIRDGWFTPKLEGRRNRCKLQTVTTKP